jgi:hypothetical protein
MNPFVKHPRAALAAATLLAISTLGTVSAKAQCSDPGLKYAGIVDVEGAFNNNGNARRDVLLPKGAVKLDPTYHQASLTSHGGGSDANSSLTAAGIPAGICIVATGTEGHSEKGWAVHSPELFVATDDGEFVTQRGFRITMYCTVGSGPQDMSVGGCNAKVAVYYKLAPTPKPVRHHSAKR